MTAAVLLDHVSAYAAAVRSHLGDLSPEQVEDLTDGLEADLAEALEDPSGPVGFGPEGGPDAVLDLRRRFGLPSDYAVELRSAAGLGVGAGPAPRRRPLRDGLRESRASLRAELAKAAAPFTTSRHWPGVRDLLLSVRPVWWVLRGWVWLVVVQGAVRLFAGSAQLSPFVPDNAFAWLVLLGLVVLSVQWGRGLVPRNRWTRGPLRLASVLAAVVVLPLLGNLVGDLTRVTDPAVVDEQAWYPGDDSVLVDGESAVNLFVYDADGNPVPSAQIFDQRGRPVSLGEDGGVTWVPGLEEDWALVPATDASGRERWNVYPRVGVPWDQAEWDESGELDLRAGVTPTPLPAPFAQAPVVRQDGVEIPQAQDADPAGARGGPDATAEDGLVDGSRAGEGASGRGSTPDPGATTGGTSVTQAP